MSYKKTLEKVKALTEEELEMANEQHPFFHSDHEGYAVIKEEVEEANDEFSHLTNRIQVAWSMIKLDAPDAKALASAMKSAKSAAQFLAAEAIQVAAMCDKFIYSQEIRK